MSESKEYADLVKQFGEAQARLILLYGLHQKGKSDETKRTALSRTLRTGKEVGGSNGNGKSPSKIVPPE